MERALSEPQSNTKTQDHGVSLRQQRAYSDTVDTVGAT